MPLGTRIATGVVWATRAGGGDNLKSIVEVRDWPALRQPLRDFIDWVARWTLAPRGSVLRMAVRAPEATAAPPPKWGFRKTGNYTARLTPARTRVLLALDAATPMAKTALAVMAGCGTGVVDGLFDDGALEAVELPAEPVAPAPDPEFGRRPLEADQEVAAEALVGAVRAKTFGVFLLEGVTGSGKTEVYFEAVAEALRTGRQSLILMPEIALTAQFLDRFAVRFGVRPAEWHSGISPRQRARTWQGVAAGEVSVVAGARSALFLPYADLGLVIVDEEHDAAYKQEDGVHYHARDMAVVRGHIAKFPVVLASATPSIETEVNARRGRYRRLALPERFGGQHMPGVEAIDLTREGPPRGRYIAPRLAQAVKTALERGQQALLFLNRRGYAPLTLCRACGFRFSCPNCDSWLVDHRFRKRLVCHHCGFSTPHPAQCPKCHAENSFVACGPGVERLEEE